MSRGSTGKITIAGANLALGYWGGVGLKGVPVASGDLGYWDEQENLHHRDLILAVTDLNPAELDKLFSED